MDVSGGSDMDVGDEEGDGGGGRAWGAGEDDGEEDDGEEEEEGGGGGGGGGAYSGSATAQEGGLSLGLAGALQLFQRSGAVSTGGAGWGGSGLAKEAYVGRTKDMRPVWQGGAEDPAAGIKLEYKDEAGRHLTPKEAYRQLSYKFHGRMPSKTVLDKRMKKAAAEEAARRGGLAAGGLAAGAAGRAKAGGGAAAGTVDTPLGTLAALHKAQEARGQAYVTLSKR